MMPHVMKTQIRLNDYLARDLAKLAKECRPRASIAALANVMVSLGIASYASYRRASRKKR
jgi:hypothetical protein